MKLTIELTDEEFAKLNKLADSRTKMSQGKTQYTPETCLRSFIRNCVTDGGGWISPSLAAARHQTKKASEDSVETSKKKTTKSRPSDDGKVW